MRNITQESVAAFNSNLPFKSGNTKVFVTEYSTELLLHNNLIAERVNGQLFIDTCGWLSNTTKERLNGLQGVSISVKKGIWYLNGIEWNGKRKRFA